MGHALTPGQAFAKSVKRARQLQGWKQHHLADRLTELGVPTHQATVARIENGKRGVSLDDAVALSIALDVPLYRLIAGQAVEDEMIAMTPREVYSADLASAHLTGDFFAATPGSSPKGLYGWWKGRAEVTREEERFERFKKAGRVRTETTEDGITVHVIDEFGDKQ